MRPYLALIIDSFREAVVSWTLWILIVPITLLLLVLVPFGVREEVATTLSRREITAAVRLVRVMRDEADSPEPSPGKHLWSLLTKQEREELQAIASGDGSAAERFRSRAAVQRVLNRLIESRKFYDPDSWKGIELDKETEALVEQDPAALSELDLQRRNRLLLQAAYPDFISAGGVRIAVQYFGFDLGQPFPSRGVRLKSLIGDVIVPAISSFLIGNIAVFIAIMVTSPITPQLFDPGSLSLLFSKPIIRSVAFLAKFFGGCAYILLCTAYLNIGLWAILGLRFGIWNSGWWTTIPVFLFLFAVYYSVSAAVGALWRNAIVAVAAAMMFWLAGFGIGVTEGFYYGIAIAPHEITRLERMGDLTVAVTRAGGLLQWDAQAEQWEPIQDRIGPLSGMRTMGPVMVETDGEKRLLVATRMSWQGLFDQPTLTILSQAGSQWEAANGIRLPRGTIELFKTPRGDVIAVAQEGVFRLDRFEEDEENSGISTGFFFKLPRFGKAAFEKIGPEAWTLHGPADVAIDPTDGRLALFDAGRVAVYRLNQQGRYERVAETSVTEDTEQGGAVAIAGDTVVCILVDGDVCELDAKSLKKRRVYRRETKNQPRSVVAARDGSVFAVVYHNRTIYLLRPESKTHAAGMIRPRWLPQRKTDAAMFDGKGQLHVVHHYRRLLVFDPRSGKPRKRISPSLNLGERIFFYVVRPLDRVIPQPGELKNTVQYLISGKETTDGDLNRADIEAFRESIHVWEPIISSGVFLVLMLGITCLVIERKDF